MCVLQPAGGQLWLCQADTFGNLSDNVGRELLNDGFGVAIFLGAFKGNRQTVLKTTKKVSFAMSLDARLLQLPLPRMSLAFSSSRIRICKMSLGCHLPELSVTAGCCISPDHWTAVGLLSVWYWPDQQHHLPGRGSTTTAPGKEILYNWAACEYILYLSTVQCHEI